MTSWLEPPTPSQEYFSHFTWAALPNRISQLLFKEISILKYRTVALHLIFANSNAREKPVLHTEIGTMCLNIHFRLTAFSHHQVVPTLIFYWQKYFWNHNQNAAFWRWVNVPSAFSVCRIVPRIIGWFNIPSVISQFTSTLPIWKKKPKKQHIWPDKVRASFSSSCRHFQRQ